MWKLCWYYFSLSLVALSWTCSGVLSETAWAVVDIDIGVRKITRTPRLPSERTHKRLSRAHSLLAGEDYQGALSILLKMEESARSRPHEHAQVLQTLGYVHAHMEKPTAAIEAFKQALALESLPAAPTLSTMYTLAQLQLMQKDYDGATSRLLEWFSYTEAPTAEAYILLATAYVEKKNYKQALPFIREGIKLMEKPREAWLQLQVAVEFGLKDYNAAATTLRTLIQHFPNEKKYFKQLTGVYLSTDDYKRALAVSEVAYLQGFVSEEADLLNLANLYLFAGIPFRAAEVLQKEMAKGRIPVSEKTLVLLASSWHRAQELEQAIDAYAKAGDVSDNGNLYVTVGQLYAELENWPKAVSFYQKARKKGGLKDLGDLEVSLGIAQFNNDDVEAAVRSFEKARGTNDKAEKWLAFARQAHRSPGD